MWSADARAGFTLIEAAAALSILGIVVVGWLAAVAGEVSSLTRASEAVTAASLARDRMTAIRLLRPAGVTRVPDSLRAGRFPPPLDAYAWEAESRPSAVDPVLMDVRVTVRWVGGEEVLDGRIRVAPTGTSSDGSP